MRLLDAGPVADLGLLDSGSRPRSSLFGQDSYPTTLTLKSAAFLHSIARNHALVDGNKRLAWLATVVFLDLNSKSTDVSPDAAFDPVVDVAKGALDVEGVAKRLRISD